MLTRVTHKSSVCSIVSDGCSYLLGKVDLCAVRICHSLTGGLSRALFDFPDWFGGWLQAEAITDTSPVWWDDQAIFHTSFLLVNSLPWGCAALGQASNCNFTDLIQLNSSPSCCTNLFASFIKCQPVSDIETVRQKLFLWADQESPLEKASSIVWCQWENFYCANYY